MTNCTKNNLQKELNYDCRANPSAVGHVINFENDVLPILDADGHMTNCTKNNLKKESN
jgi:hypothetical protein